MVLLKAARGRPRPGLRAATIWAAESQVKPRRPPDEHLRASANVQFASSDLVSAGWTDGPGVGGGSPKASSLHRNGHLCLSGGVGRPMACVTWQRGDTAGHLNGIRLGPGGVWRWCTSVQSERRRCNGWQTPFAKTSPCETANAHPRSARQRATRLQGRLAAPVHMGAAAEHEALAIGPWQGGNGGAGWRWRRRAAARLLLGVPVERPCLAVTNGGDARSAWVVARLTSRLAARNAQRSSRDQGR
jgi:hypothetical protein